MGYLTPADLIGFLGKDQGKITWGVGPLPVEADVQDVIDEASRTIDGFCRARYTVPWDPVPDDIVGICRSLCLAHLLPVVHPNSERIEARAKLEYQAAMDLLESIQGGTYSLEDGDDASATVNGGPVIVAATARDRLLSTEDYY